MFNDIENGAEFYFSAIDYINEQPKLKVKAEVKTEAAPLAIPPASSTRKASTSRLKLEKSPGKRRPRRTAAPRSYVVPDSDDDDILDEAESTFAVHMNAKRRKVESNLQRWIKELSVVLKEEQRKVCQRMLLYFAVLKLITFTTV